MQVYKAPMPAKVLAVFFLMAALVAGATAWAFRSGFTWTGICLMAVGLPMALLYWYVLWANPARTTFNLVDEGLYLKAPPFFTATVPWGDIQAVFQADWDDRGLSIKDAKRSLRFGGYKAGVFEMESGHELLAAARPGRVVVIDTAHRRYVLGPKKLDEFQQAVASHVN